MKSEPNKKLVNIIAGTFIAGFAVIGFLAVAWVILFLASNIANLLV